MIINIGFGNALNSDKILSIVKPDAAPVKRLVQTAKDNGNCIDATCGRKCKSVVVSDNGYIILTALLPETISVRANNIRAEQKGDY